MRRLDDCAAGARFAVGHYHESRSGRAIILVADPEVELLLTPSGDWVPTVYRAPFANTVTAVVTGDVVRAAKAAEHVRLTKLVDVWMANVAANLLGQDHFEEEIRRPVTYAAE